MMSRVYKCSTFGLQKTSNFSAQFLPKLIINHDVAPPVQINKPLQYLRRFFNFTLDNQEHMTELLETVNNLSWNLTIASLSKTWLIENLDSVVSKYVRHWPELPITSKFNNLVLSKTKYGINLILPSLKRSSPNHEIKHLCKETSQHTNVKNDQ